MRSPGPGQCQKVLLREYQRKSLVSSYRLVHVGASVQVFSWAQPQELWESIYLLGWNTADISCMQQSEPCRTEMILGHQARQDWRDSYPASAAHHPSAGESTSLPAPKREEIFCLETGRQAWKTGLIALGCRWHFLFREKEQPGARSLMQVVEEMTRDQAGWLQS